GNGKDAVCRVKQFLLCGLIIPKKEKLLVHDGAADGAAFLVAMKGGRSVVPTGHKLLCLVEGIVGGKDIRAENREGISMELVPAGFAGHADDARAAALIGGRSVLGFHAELVHAILGNLHGWENG